QNRIEVANPDSFPIHLPQESFYLVRQEHLLNRHLQPGVFLRLLNLDGSLFKSHFCHPEATRFSSPKDLGTPRDQSRVFCELANSRVWRASKSWSGRRESNPRPTAWKAVTLPLSYSRKTSCQRSAVSLPRTLATQGSRLTTRWSR